MRWLLCALLVLTTLPLTTALVNPAHAGDDDGGVAAGVIGGLAAGALLGATMPRPHYEDEYPPAEVYVTPEYESDCYWTRGRAYWDDDRDRWVYPRIRVCH